MRDEGKISPDEFLQTNFNDYYLTAKEFAKPFNGINSPVVKSGLRLVSIETRLIHCSCLNSWIESGMSKGL